MHTPSHDRMPALLAYYGDKLKPKDKSPLTFMKAHFGIADEPLVKAMDKRDTHTESMFGEYSQLQLRKDGVMQHYHHAAKPEAASPGPTYKPVDIASKEFKEWFGNSRLTDSNDKPLLLYHATPQDITEFVPGGLNPKLSGPAIWATPNRESPPAAHNIRQVPGNPNRVYGNQSGKYTPGTNVMPIYMRIENAIGSNPSNWKEVYKQFGEGGSPWTMTPEFVAKAKAAGYDGIMHFDANGDLIEAAAFSAAQVKSAISNTGDFSRNSSVITKSQPRILLLKGGKPGAPGLYERAIAGKDGIKRIHWVRMPGGAKTAHNDAQAELFNIDGTPYQSLETRPGTTGQQRAVGMDALAALKRRVNLLRDHRGSAATLLGARLYAGFVATGGNQLTGQKVTSPADLASLAQVYRDPRFETFRCIFLKGNEVVGETAYSSRLPGAVRLPDDYQRLVENDKQRFGANGYYMLHNHPSGESRPSKADERLTGDLNAAVSGMRAHVIIDHNEYSVIEKGGAVRTHQAPELSGTDYHAAPSIDHPLLGAKLGSPKDVALAAKTLQQELKAGAPVLIMTKGYHSEVDLIASAPLSLMMQKASRVKAWLRGTGRAAGAGAHVFLVVSNADYQSHYAALSGLIADGIVADVASASGMSIRENRPPMVINDDVFRPTKAGRKVAEPQRLEDDLVAQERYLTDGAKALGYATIDDLAVADYSAFERLATDWRAGHQVEDALYQPASGYNQDGQKP